MSTKRRPAERYPIIIVIALLLALHFYLRPRLWDGRGAPDFLLLALLLVALRSRPGTAAIVGFLVGLITDVLTPARFGAGALAHTVVAYLAAWGRAVFFPDNVLVSAGLFAGAVWVRTAILLLASGAAAGELASGLGFWAPLQAATTAVAGVVLLLVARDRLAIRLDE
ncbi:MAG: rod shape-determining protein MreD [Gemmatimonadota bacterium]